MKWGSTLFGLLVIGVTIGVLDDIYRRRVNILGRISQFLIAISFFAAGLLFVVVPFLV